MPREPHMAWYTASLTAVYSGIVVFFSRVAVMALVFVEDLFFRLAYAGLYHILEGLQTGFIKIEDSCGFNQDCNPHNTPSTPLNLAFGESRKGALETTLYIKSRSFWAKVLFGRAVGFAEAYTAGDVQCSNLVSLFRILIQHNRFQIVNPSFSIFSFFVWIFSHIVSFLYPRSSVTAQDLVSNIFAAFLSADMNYSCPIWNTSLPSIRFYNDLGNDIQGTGSLESAQYRKLICLIVKAQIKESDHVLEIGTGWGSFAILATQLTGCKVTSITLSKEQKNYAERRIKGAGLVDKISVLLGDYSDERTVKTVIGEGKFDKIISIETLSSIREENLETHFGYVGKLLKEGGIAVFQCTTMPYKPQLIYKETHKFIAQSSSPNFFLPSKIQLFNSIVNGSGGRLHVESVEDISGHYCLALRKWREAFLSNFEEKIKPILIAQFQEQDVRAEADWEAKTLAFKRMWEYYFSYLEAGFSERALNNIIITVAREESVEL